MFKKSSGLLNKASYKITDKNNNIIKTFKSKMCANYALNKLEKDCFCELKILPINENVNK